MAAAGKQEALEKQGPELLVGQRPALYMACGVWPRALQGLCLRSRSHCEGWEGQCSCPGDQEGPQSRVGTTHPAPHSPGLTPLAESGALQSRPDEQRLSMGAAWAYHLRSYRCWGQGQG